MNKSAAETELADILNSIKNGVGKQNTSDDCAANDSMQADTERIACDTVELIDERLNGTSQVADENDPNVCNGSGEDVKPNKSQGLVTDNKNIGVSTSKKTIDYESYNNQIRHYENKIKRLENYLKCNIQPLLDKKDRTISRLREKSQKNEESVAAMQKEIKKLQSELKAKDYQISDLKRSKKEANYYLNQQLSQVLNENEDIRRELEIYKSNAFLQKIKSEQDTVKKLTEPIKNQVFDLLSKVRR